MIARVYFIFVIAFGLLACGAVAHFPTVARCNHDEMQTMVNRLTKRGADVLPQNYVTSPTSNTTVGPIRINVFYLTPDIDSLNSANPMACQKIGDIINVNGRPYTCVAEDILTDKKYEIANTVVKNYLVPELADLIQLNRIVDVVNIPENIYGGLVYMINIRAKYDLVLAVTYRPDSWDVIASGVSLAYDQNGRTVLGLLNWNPRNLDPSVSTDLYRKVGLHEMLHVLGFSQERMIEFHNITTLDQSTGESQAYQELQLKGMESDGREITLLTSPKVQQDFREHFGCETAEGAVLEDQGGYGVAGSHWEMTVFMDELMTASVSTKSVLTNITLSALEDSGWYYVNRTHASHLLWGLKKGCDFVYKRCNSSWPVGDGYFCEYDKKGLEGCTYDRMGIGTCDFRFWVSIPEKYRYFGDEHIGGPVEYADYCPFTYSNFLCTDSSQSKSSSYGDLTGASSRCFMSSLTDSPDASAKQPEAPKCYPHHCFSSEGYAIQIGNYWYPCPAGGNISDVISFSGTLFCPDASMFCTGAGVDKRFPVFTKVEPAVAKPGDVIRITGKNLVRSATITVGVPCDNVTLDLATSSLTCVISASSEYSAEAGLKNIIIKQNSYSLAVPNAFTLELSMTSWFLTNWFLTACIAIAAVVLVLTIVIVICKCCTTSRKWKKYQESKGNAGKKKQNEFGNDVEFQDMA